MWEDRQDAELEDEATAILLEEIDLIERLVDQSEAHSERVARAAAYLLDAIPDPDAHPPDSIAGAVQELSGFWTTDASVTTYDLLVNSGRIDVVSNPALTQCIVLLRSLMQVKDRREDWEVTFLLRELQPYLDRYVDRRRFMDRAWYEARGVDPPEAPGAPERYSELLADRAFLNLVHRRVERRVSVENFLELIRAEIDGIRELTE